MKKKMIQRGLLGFPLGIAIGFVITVIISMCIGDGSFYPVTPELIDTMKNELNAVILQTILCGILGTGIGILSYVGIFVAIFVITWLVQYFVWKRKVKRMNDGVRKSNNAK